MTGAEAPWETGRRIYRWDLDKTYLETDIGSWRGLLRSALEPAHWKRAVPGATALVQGLGREGDIFLLSGSPTQMRRRLEEKLRLDGVRVDTFILKDNLANVRRGRLRAIRSQFPYKLVQLLAARAGAAGAMTVRESCFGDDAEADALVYSVYADAVAGRVGPVELAQLMKQEGAYPDQVVEALAALRRVERAEAVERIFIHLTTGRTAADFAALGARVVPVRSWLQAAVVLFGSGEIGAAVVGAVDAGCALPEGQRAALIGEIAAQGALPEGTLGRLAAADPDRWGRIGEGPLAGPLAGGPSAGAGAPVLTATDYAGLLRGFRRVKPAQ